MKFKNELRQLTTPIIYDTWFKDMEYLGTYNNIFIFRVPMKIHKDCIINNYLKMLSDIITTITKHECEIILLV